LTNSMYNILCLWSWSLMLNKLTIAKGIDDNEEDADDAQEES